MFSLPSLVPDFFRKVSSPSPPFILPSGCSIPHYFCSASSVSLHPQGSTAFSPPAILFLAKSHPHNRDRCFTPKPPTPLTFGKGFKYCCLSSMFNLICLLACRNCKGRLQCFVERVTAGWSQGTACDGDLCCWVYRGRAVCSQSTNTHRDRVGGQRAALSVWRFSGTNLFVFDTGFPVVSELVK